MTTKDDTRSVPRLSLGLDEAAQALGISRDHLERHVLPELKVCYLGRRRIIAVSELQRFLDINGVRAGGVS
jgi:hypothetical protein